MNFQEEFQKVLNRTLTGTEDSDQHLVTMFAIAVQIKAKKILELGVRSGTTTEPLLLACSLTDGTLISVDLNPTSFVPQNELKPRWKFNQMDAIVFLEHAASQNLRYDLIYVDDWHTYLHVKRELELISKISDFNTVILLHDLMGMGTHPNYFLPASVGFIGTEWEGGGPLRAVYELDINEWEWATIPVCHGLTLLRKRSPIIEK